MITTRTFKQRLEEQPEETSVDSQMMEFEQLAVKIRELTQELAHYIMEAGNHKLISSFKLNGSGTTALNSIEFEGLRKEYKFRGDIPEEPS
jgi:hypothetical protein